MDIKGKTILVTGANRGIGASLVKSLLKNGAGKVYAAARTPASLPDFGDKRVVPLKLDITKQADVAAAAKTTGAVDVLINNAGIANGGDILADVQLADMDVNYYGTTRMVQAYAPLLEKQGGGVIANVISMVGLASIPYLAGYSASKAALFSATQAARAALKPKKIDVVGIFPGPIDTDLAKDLPLPNKASPDDTADDIVQGLIAGDEDIYPDPASKQLSGLWGTNPKALEHTFSSF